MNPHYRGCKELRGPCDTVQEREQWKRTTLQAYEEQGSWISEPKKDGIWCSITVHKSRGTCRIHTKTETIRTIPSLALVITDCATLPDRCVLIGELGIGSQESVAERNRVGHDFVDVFDILLPNECNASLRARKQELFTVLRNMSATELEWIRIVPWMNRDFVALYDSQPEGIVLKDLGECYCDSTWLKVKKQFTDNYVLMDWELSTAKTKIVEPMAAKIVCGMFVSGVLTELVKVGGLSHHWSREFAQNFEAYRGKVVELAHFKMFKSGSLRHPSFVRIREDDIALNCILDERIGQHED